MAERYQLTKNQMYNFRWACELYELSPTIIFRGNRHFCKRSKDTVCGNRVCPKLRFIPNDRLPVDVVNRNTEQEEIVRK